MKTYGYKYIYIYFYPFPSHPFFFLPAFLPAFSSRCLSGNTAQDIQKVDPQFIKTAKIEQSLTPGRNNGFLNMLRSMKQKALALDAAARESATAAAGGEESVESSSTTTTDSSLVDPNKGPKYNAIMTALAALKPSSIVLMDNSHQHAGHAGNDMEQDGESHFELQIVAEAFEGLHLVKRHQLIYMMLGQIMPQIHALQIQALTPQEAEERSRSSG